MVDKTDKLLKQIKKEEQRIAIASSGGEGMFLPNYSGVQTAALKTSAALGAAGHTIQDEGSSLTQRTKLNFSGSNVSAVDDATNNATIINVTGGGGDVTSVFTRTGAVVAATNDYTWAQVDKTTSSIADITTKSHTALSDIGTNTHAQVDTHILSGSIHFNKPLDHTASGDISNVGTNTHAQIDTHILSGSIHFNKPLSHTASGDISNVGTNTHTQIDTHILSGSIHFAEGSINHINIGSIGTNTHAQIDTHIADASDPHTATLTQTNVISSGTMSGSNIIITSDKTLSGSAYVPNIVFGTVSGSHTASNYTQGSLLVIYTS